MRSLTKFAAVFTLFASHAFAGGSAIDVGHGIKLGETFEPEQAISTQKSTFGNKVLHKFKPVSADGNLGNYYVALTPESGRVYEIWAIKHFEKSVPCRDLRDASFKKLQERFPDAQTKRAMMSPDGRRSVIKGGTTVSVACKTGIGKSTFYMRHRHEALHNQVAQR